MVETEFIDAEKAVVTYGKVIAQLVRKQAYKLGCGGIDYESGGAQRRACAACGVGEATAG